MIQGRQAGAAIKRSLDGGELMVDTWTLNFTDAGSRVCTTTYDKESAFISAWCQCRV